MDENNISILGLLITDIRKEAGKAQDILTKFGCTIRTRLGLHTELAQFDNSGGLILLELYGDIEERKKLKVELEKLSGIQVREMNL